MENLDKSIISKVKINKSVNQELEDICYSSVEIVEDLKHWEHKVGFSKWVEPKPGPYLDAPSKPWSHHSNTPPPPRDY